MRNKDIVYFLLASIALFSFRTAIEDTSFVIPTRFPLPVYDFSKNKLTKDGIQLGRVLFYDPILSRNNSISCASCHSQYAAFAHIDHALSHGIDDSIGLRNAPALMNLAWQKTFMRDGAINHLDMQALAPITHPKEMGENFIHAISKLRQSNVYPSLFYKAFNDSIITGERTLKAISQFMLTLVSANSKYDSVLRKQAYFSAQEKKGYKLFKQYCACCHAEPLFTNDEFMNNGLALDTTLNDFGRQLVTQQSSDYLKFKVPTLRNIELTMPYMHDGRYKSLSHVLNHYTNGVQHSKTLATQLHRPIVLTSNEKVDIIAFLLTLTDKHFLFNRDFAYPKDILLK